MYIQSPWYPALVAIAPIVLIALLLAGRSQLRRTQVLVAAGAVVSAIAFGAFYAAALLQSASSAVPGYVAALTASRVAEVIVSYLMVAAWVLPLYGAVQDRRRGWLVALVLAFILSLVIPTAVSISGLPFYHVMVQWTRRDLVWSNELLYAAVHVGAVLALLFALITPHGPASASNGPSAAETSS